MKKQVKKRTPATSARLLLIAGFLFTFALGLGVARWQPGAVLALLVVLVFVVLVLVSESVYLWQAAKRRALSKPFRMKRSLSGRGVAQ